MRLIVVLALLSLPAFADGFPAILSTLAVGGPLAPVFAMAWSHKKTQGRSGLSRWCAFFFSVPAAVGAFNMSFSVAFGELAGSEWGILCGPLILGSCFLAARLPGGLLCLAPARRNNSFDDGDALPLLPGRVVSKTRIAMACDVATLSMVVAVSVWLLYLALNTDPDDHYPPAPRPKPAPDFVWSDDDLDDTCRVTLNRVALGMTYDEIVRASGGPTDAWYKPKPGWTRNLFTDSEIEQLRRHGLAGFPTIETVRFEPDFTSGDTAVVLDEEGLAVAIYGDSLEFDGRQVATSESGPPWLPPLKLALPPPDELQMMSHRSRDYYYRSLGLRIDFFEAPAFSLHSERQTK